MTTTLVAAQLEALDFPCHRLRQLAAESHFPRNFVRYEPLFDVLANFRRQFLRALRIPAQYHMRDGIRKSALVGRADHRGFRRATSADFRIPSRMWYCAGMKVRA